MRWTTPHRAQKEGPSALSTCPTKPQAREACTQHGQSLRLLRGSSLPSLIASQGFKRSWDNNVNFCPCRLSFESMPILTSTCPLGRGWPNTTWSVFLYLDNRQASVSNSLVLVHTPSLTPFQDSVSLPFLEPEAFFQL